MPAKKEATEQGGGIYFAAPKKHRQFIKTGSKMLDLALGGGWAENRIINVIGDSSTGKTLLCIEAMSQFAIKYPKGKGHIKYREAEEAFDEPYAGALGLPLDRVDFGDQPLETIEDVFEELQDIIDAAFTEIDDGRKPLPILYVVDSLDALSDRGEMKRDIDEGSYGAEKAKKLSQLFRRLVRRLDEANVTVMIVSQVRDRIGVTYGSKTTRSGGKALTFYCSQIVTLAQLGRLKKTVKGIERVIGLDIKASIIKNKVTDAHRDAEFDILFRHGIDDLPSCLYFLRDAGHLTEFIAKPKVKGAMGKYLDNLDRLPDAEYRKQRDRIYKAVEKNWYVVEQSFNPKRRKLSYD